MKVREIYEKLQGKYDPELVGIIARLAENNATMKQQLLTVATLIDGLQNHIGELHRVMGVVGTQHASVMKKLGLVSDATDMVKSYDPKDDDDLTPTR